ncbi:MAG TPA: imelysin family protein [Roseiflexaceae bacterium]|jgi:hypothetical protein|nr:imelysin family protein [Roseiflexaceae bacterium]
MKRYVIPLAIAMTLLAACGSAPVAAPQEQAVPTNLPSAASSSQTTADAANLNAIKTYLLQKTSALKANTARLQQASERYYNLAAAATFDYNALAQQPDALAAAREAREAWLAASPGYEQMEGVVAGTASLADYDVILDAGGSGADDPENAVPFDLKLPDGRVLARPGNLFGVTESALWGTEPDYTSNVPVDLNGNGAHDFGELLPEANVLKAAADALDRYAGELVTAAQAWQPTRTDAFTALVVMVPTMNEYFDSWKNSRFVSGDASRQRDFVAISRLSDMQDILGGLQVVYEGVSPEVQAVDTAQDTQISEGLTDLKAFVADIYSREQSGKRFTPEDADLLGAEAQNRATALTGQIAQVAAKLHIQVEE